MHFLIACAWHDPATIWSLEEEGSQMGAIEKEGVCVASKGMNHCIAAKFCQIFWFFSKIKLEIKIFT